MKKTLLSLLCIAFLSGSAFAADPAADPCKGINKEFLSAQLPVPIGGVVSTSPMPGERICIAIISGQMGTVPAFITEGKTVFVGDAFRDKTSLSAQARYDAGVSVFKRNVDALKGAVAFAYKPAGALRHMYMFTDPECSACNQVKAEVQRWAKENIVEVRVVMLPSPARPAGRDDAIRGICGGMTYDQYVKGAYSGTACKEGEDKIAKSLKVASDLGVRVTPTFIWSDGTRVDGYNRPALDALAR